MRTSSRLAPLLLVLLSSPCLAAGFFDGLPRSAYVKEDVSWTVVRAGSGVEAEPFATLRYLLLALDSGRRDRAFDTWPEREMLLVELASGERVAFERLSRLEGLLAPADYAPVSRIGLSGVAFEVLARGSAAQGGACGGDFQLLRVGALELPLAREDREVESVRLALSQLADSFLAARQAEAIESAVQVMLRADRARALAAGSLEGLRLLFPDRTFSAVGDLQFRPSTGQPLDPGSGEWRQVTDAPEMRSGVPAF